MLPLEVILIITIIILLGIIFYLFTKLSSKKPEDNSLKLLQEQIIALNKNIDFKLAEANRNTLKQSEINTNISKEASLRIEEITKKLSNLEETNKQIKDI
jgi:hypothetical protein